MEFDELGCACGRSFSQPNALTNHRRKCSQSKKRLAEALTLAQEARASKKQKRSEEGAEIGQVQKKSARKHRGPQHTIEDQAATLAQIFEEPQEVQPTRASRLEQHQPSRLTATSRPQRTSRGRLPGKLRDMVPHSLSPLYTEAHFDQAFLGISEEPPEGPRNTQQTEQTSTPGPSSTSAIFKSKKNAFGLYRQYSSKTAPTHDPEGDLTLEDLCEEESSHPTQLSQDDAATLESTEPEDATPLESTEPEDATPLESTEPEDAAYWPYPNRSSFLLGEWYWTGSTQKSKKEFSNLVKIICDKDFDPADLTRIPWEDINSVLGSSQHTIKPQDNQAIELLKDARWMQEEVKINVPFHRLTGAKGQREYTVGTFFRRSIVDILKEKVSGPDFTQFHIEPFELKWESSLRNATDSSNSESSHAERVYGETYCSARFLKMHEDIQSAPSQPPDCKLPRVVVALMFASDETHLTQFGETKLWPLYLFFGNESKYRRCQPNQHLCQHVAYLTRLSDEFGDFYSAATNGKAPSSALAAHCSREVLHAQWRIILDEEFVHAYEFGIVITCFDGVERRFYLRIFTYSADYKEKTIVSTIRNLGDCPCPRCLTPLSLVKNMGTPLDKWRRQNLKRFDNAEYRKKISDARKLIYKKHVAVSNADVEKLLKPDSLVSTQNAFSERLSKLGFSIFETQVTDLMHEIESGTWRSFFIHFLRILGCIGENRTHVLDERYRQVPAFGRDTIRKFRRNCSDMKNLAARDWEDMLQCAIPVFEGLLPEQSEENDVNENGCLLDVLFLFATWHGLAKLRMHTDTTIKLLDQATSALGSQLRVFKARVCSRYKTKELSREAAARARRKLCANLKKGSKQKPSENKEAPLEVGLNQVDLSPSSTESIQAPSATGEPGAEKEPPSSNSPGIEMVVSNNPDQPSTTETSSNPSKKSERRLKVLNLNTYKFHSIGDYVETIKMYGTTDSYSTEPGELEHRTPKNRYRRTSKKNYVLQLTQIERRQARIRRIRQNLEKRMKPAGPRAAPLASSRPEDRYLIGKAQNNAIDIVKFMKENSNDPAAKHFYRDLRSYLLHRVKEMKGSENVGSVVLHRERIYEHKILRLNYTTYDIRRCQDVINPKTSNRDVMMLASAEQLAESNHPYIYARVLGVFHANVVCLGEGSDGTPMRVDFLWVRWFNHEPSLTPLRLERLSFPSISEDNATSFVDPSLLIRTCHVIPAFANERLTDQGITHSILTNTQDDWKVYYINHFADRDALMRHYWGLGIGHVPSLQGILEGIGIPSWRSAGLFKDVCERPDKTGDECQPEGEEPEAGYLSDGQSEAGELGLREREDEDLSPLEDVLSRPENSDDEINDEDIERSYMYPS